VNTGKGRGRQVIAVARTADVILMMLDAVKGDVQRSEFHYAAFLFSPSFFVCLFIQHFAFCLPLITDGVVVELMMECSESCWKRNWNRLESDSTSESQISTLK